MSSNTASLRWAASELLRRIYAIRGQLPSSLSTTKYLLLLLLFVNARSFPLVWHFRVFRPVTWMRIQYRLMKWRTVFLSRVEQKRAEDAWFDSIAPIGANPFNLVTKYVSWASFDDSDFNGHLSNSSYAKTLDAARFKAALQWFPLFFRAGGWMPLAGTHYSFLREIPILRRYEVRVTLAAWDSKWLYVICKFVTYPSNPKNKKSRTLPEPDTSTPPASSSADALFHASLRTPADEISATPLPSTSSTPPTTQALAAALAHTPEPDGATLHTLAISQLCFKHGRITVPPALVLALNGFAAPPSGDGAAPYSHKHPPPHWPSVKALADARAGEVRRLLLGEWRGVPEGERWWDAALGGVIEDQRKANLVVLDGVRGGMEGVREFA